LVDLPGQTRFYNYKNYHKNTIPRYNHIILKYYFNNLFLVNFIIKKIIIKKSRRDAGNLDPERGASMKKSQADVSFARSIILGG
jgi:hypothetical protein